MAILLIEGKKPKPIRNLVNVIMFGPTLGQALKHPEKNKTYRRFKKLFITGSK